MAAPLSDAERDELEDRLGRLAQGPAALEPLDIGALDGFLAGVLLQPRPVPEARWWPLVVDAQRRPLPASVKATDAQRLQQLVQRRHAELDRAIGRRDWFDPWVYAGEPEEPPGETVAPWVMGFVTAMEAFPALMDFERHPDPAVQDEFNEALAGLYQHLDAEDLEDAEALLAEIESLEPCATLEEAVESLVRSCLLLADLSRPHPAPRRRV